MAAANPQGTENWRDWIQEDPGSAGHLIVKPPLKPVKPVPWSHMMAKRGDIMYELITRFHEFCTMYDLFFLETLFVFLSKR